jgi:DNA-binding NarL/FixJ family response regulator
MSLKIFKILFVIADPQAEADVGQKLSDVRTVVFEVVTARTFAEALAVLSANSFDVYLANLAVPDCQGSDSLRRLILAASEAPVIVVSSLYDDAQALEAVRAGAEDDTVGNRMNSAAFERVILYSIERQMAHQRTALQFSVSRVLAESSTIRDAANGILATVCEFAKFDRGEVWQSDLSQNQLILLTSWLPASQSNASAERNSASPSQSNTATRGQGLVGRVWESCAPECIPNRRGEPAGNQGSSENSPSAIQAAVAIPLSIGTGALGVLALFGEGTQNRDEDSAKLLTSVGG